MKWHFAGIVIAALWFGCIGQAKTSPNDRKPSVTRQPALPSDIYFMKALAAMDESAATRFLDDDFTWTDTRGRVLAKADYLQAMGDSAMAGATDPVEHNYGRVSIITSSKARTQLARIWVLRKTGWRLLTYDE